MGLTVPERWLPCSHLMALAHTNYRLSLPGRQLSEIITSPSFEITSSLALKPCLAAQAKADAARRDADESSAASQQLQAQVSLLEAERSQHVPAESMPSTPVQQVTAVCVCARVRAGAVQASGLGDEGEVMQLQG